MVSVLGSLESSLKMVQNLLNQNKRLVCRKQEASERERDQYYRSVDNGNLSDEWAQSPLIEIYWLLLIVANK